MPCPHCSSPWESPHQSWETMGAILCSASSRQHFVHLLYKTTLSREHDIRIALPRKPILSGDWLPLYREAKKNIDTIWKPKSCWQRKIVYFQVAPQYVFIFPPPQIYQLREVRYVFTINETCDVNGTKIIFNLLYMELTKTLPRLLKI